MNTQVKAKTILRVVLPLIMALVSIFCLTKVASSPQTYEKTIASLDEKKETVMGLAAASTVASTLISAVPDDTASPIADKLAELSSCFLIILSAIYLEKYALTIIGYLTFGILIPIACVLSAADAFFVKAVFKNIVRKLVIVGLVIICIIPVGEKVSGIIQDTYDESIQATINMATQELDAAEEEAEGITAIFSKITEGVTSTLEKVENILGSFVEAIAIMIVTSCLIPLAVVLVFVWFIKFMFGVNINFPEKEDLMIVKKGVRKLRGEKLLETEE